MNKFGISAICCAILGIVGAGYLVWNTTTVQAGYVGVRVNLYADKGIQKRQVDNKF